jgi:hypothetical protein
MKKRVMILFFICLGAALPQYATASGLCCQLTGGVQESLQGVASPAAGKLSLQLTYSFTPMDTLREGTEKKSLQDVANEGRYMTVPTKMGMTKYSLTAAYGFSPKFSAFVTIPYVRNTMDMAMVTDMGDLGMNVMKESMEPVHDIGDVTVMGIYRIYANDDLLPTDSVSIGAGVKTPTGSSTKKSASGSFIHAHMQPGTGSWDPVFSLIYAKMANPFLFQADATYEIATRNQNGYKFGDSFMASLSGKYAVSSFFNLAGGLTYLHLNRASDNDGKYTDLTSVMDDPANTGGDSIWLSPGIQVLPLKNSMIDLKVQFPVWERVNGVQLVSRYRVFAAVSYSF